MDQILFEEPGCDTELEELVASGEPLPCLLPAVTPIIMFIGETERVEDSIWGPFIKVKAFFNSSKVLGKQKHLQFNPDTRMSWTNTQRSVVLKGEWPSDLQTYSVRVGLSFIFELFCTNQAI